MITTLWVSRKDWNLWYSLFKDSGGRFLMDPIDYGDRLRVKYEFNSLTQCNVFEKEFKRLRTEIVEIDGTGFMGKLKRFFNIKQGRKS